ncbi:Tn3 family transposase [Roseovarius sp. D0-M9]|uniref:Tn3 family transposase n=1 Tax=Roseovarius sp. D0-M9 TaxID=3127117 RepID=UPI003010360E
MTKWSSTPRPCSTGLLIPKPSFDGLPNPNSPKRRRQNSGAPSRRYSLCRHLRFEAFRREIHEGLNVVENENSANSFMFFAMGDEIATNHVRDEETAAHDLHLLQSSLVDVNTRVVQPSCATKKWSHAWPLRTKAASPRSPIHTSILMATSRSFWICGSISSPWQHRGVHVEERTPGPAT